ncbi:MAG: family 20 glycosylhydrolase [Bacteroidota bacterium]|nr:family 20 glycosylhydrolase [Bacteroidota bacterium]
MKKLLLSVCFIFLFTGVLVSQQHNLLPVPSQITWGTQRLQLDKNFHVVMNDTTTSRAGKAVERFLRRLDNRTHLFIDKNFYKKSVSGKGPSLTINYSRKGLLKAGEDETYTLTVSGDHAQLDAPTDIGVLRGLETFLQLIQFDNTGYFITGVTIKDEPRFVWRGLLIDVGRHFSPVDVIKRNLDGMAMVKMNVLHLHLTEDQGFRIESKIFPKLHTSGSNGEYFTQQQIRELIECASDRGIRIVPEFDMPGHVTSWFAGHPELASAPGPYVIEKKFGVFDPSMNPANKNTYKFLKKFLGELCALFPDDYFHIGGDENNGKQWDANKEIQAFMNKNDLKDNHALQNYFNTKIFTILKKNKKNMIGWDEILQPGLPAGAVIQSWRGKEGVVAAASGGYNVILSNGYYIDLVQPAWKHYINDPLPADVKLAADEQKKILGGEATMWAELVTPETIDSRIWPRTAAIAERLWSDREVNNIPDMYRRLAVLSIQLEETGLQHLKNQDMMIRRLCPQCDIAPLRLLVSLVEPLKDYNRHSQGIAYSTDLPFTRLPDIAFPESDSAREFKMLCEKFVKGRNNSVKDEIKIRLESWRDNHQKFIETVAGNPALKDWITLSALLKTTAIIGLESLELLNHRENVSDSWVAASDNTLKEARKPIHESELVIVEPVMMLFQHVLPK